MKLQNHIQTTANPPLPPPCGNYVIPGVPRISPVLDSEDEDEFNLLYTVLRAEFAPRSYTEEMIFDEIIHVQWHQRRNRAIENALLAMAAARPEVLDEFADVSGIALTAAAHQHVAANSKSPDLINRQLTRLARELQSLILLYIRIHGPLQPPQPLTSAPTSDSPKTAQKNEPIPINEHTSPKIRVHFTFANPAKPRPRPVATPLAPPRAAAAGEGKEY